MIRSNVSFGNHKDFSLSICYTIAEILSPKYLRTGQTDAMSGIAERRQRHD